MSKSENLVRGVFNLITEKTTSAMTSELTQYTNSYRYPSRMVSRSEIAKDLQEISRRLNKVSKQIIESTQIDLVKILYKNMEGRIEREDLMRLFDGLDLRIEEKIEGTRKNFMRTLPNYIPPRETKNFLNDFGNKLIRINRIVLNSVGEELSRDVIQITKENNDSSLWDGLV
ncbi:MAG: hypothetical protein ACFFDT_23960 [Candidatus Hodarchaeota archaeon]